MNYWHWEVGMSAFRPLPESSFHNNAANSEAYVRWLVRTDDLLIFYFSGKLWIQWRTP